MNSNVPYNSVSDFFLTLQKYNNLSNVPIYRLVFLIALGMIHIAHYKQHFGMQFIKTIGFPQTAHGICSTAQRNCSRAFSNTERGKATFRRINPRPSSPNISPSFNAKPAFSINSRLSSS